ncbi:MAG: DnaJ domain-containing protein [Desulfobacteraceae bacterium]|nr:DnaJ domain-containing protein [Desulfobacteraceae bacterium]
MIPINDHTYYEILEVPANASFYDLRKAYKELLSIYDMDSLSTYSLFTPLEREKILAQVELAFQILGDGEKRKAYDRLLLESGRIVPEMLLRDNAKNSVPIFQATLPQEDKVVNRKIKTKVREKKIRALMEEIQLKELISGQDLKSLRKALHIELMDMFEVTRVSVSILEAIEENCQSKLPSLIYLKGFLKSYALFLGLVPEKIIAGYMAHLYRP